MMLLEIALLIAGVLILLVGYRRNHRNLMLIGAIVLFLSGALPQFAAGYRDGVGGSPQAAPAG